MADRGPSLPPEEAMRRRIVAARNRAMALALLALAALFFTITLVKLKS